MTETSLPRDELAIALEACLSLPDIAELLDPLFLQRAHELLVTLESTPPDAAIFDEICRIAEISITALRARYAELSHELDTLIELVNKNREVEEQLSTSLKAEQIQSQDARQSFNIARKLIARQGGILLNHLDNTHIEQLVAKSVTDMLKSPTTGALTQAMHALISDALAVFEDFDRQTRQIMNVIEAVYDRFNQLPGFSLEPPQLSGQENCRHHLEQLGNKTSEFCRNPLNLMMDKSSLAKKFGVKIISPLRDIFSQLSAETEWWLKELSIPVQKQIQKQKVALEKRAKNIDMIRDQISVLQTRIEETEDALARLQKQEAKIEWVSLLTQASPFANPG